jgi:hypothetical protein
MKSILLHQRTSSGVLKSPVFGSPAAFQRWLDVGREAEELAALDAGVAIDVEINRRLAEVHTIRDYRERSTKRPVSETRTSSKYRAGL